MSSFSKRVVRLTLLRDVHTCAGEGEREDESVWEAFMPEEIEEGGGMVLTVEELSDILVLDEASTVDGSSRLGNVLDV